jgi:hypothetical protein
MSVDFVRWFALRTLLVALLALAIGLFLGSAVAVLFLAVVCVLTVLKLRLALPPAPARRRSRRAVDTSTWPTLDHISQELGWSALSRRHYDLGGRKLLQRVAAARLSTRAGIDLWSPLDRARAAAAFGPQLWPLLDPSRPASGESHSGGVDGRTIDAILDRLDAL